MGEPRTSEEQRIVQSAVVRQISQILADGNNVVLEFINYEDPPRPLIHYYEELQKYPIKILIQVLRPTESVIMQRKRIRGRESDQKYEIALKNTKQQLACLESSYMQKEWILDNSYISIEDMYNKYFLAFVQN